MCLTDYEYIYEILFQNNFISTSWLCKQFAFHSAVLRILSILIDNID